MNLENKNGYQLDEVSVKVWQMLREGLNMEVILKKIVEEYDIGPDQAREDMKAIFDDFLKEGLIARDSAELIPCRIGKQTCALAKVSSAGAGAM